MQKRGLRLVIDLMLFFRLSPLMFYSSNCFILKQYVLLCTTYLLILRLRKSVIFSPVHPTGVHSYNDRFSDDGNLHVNISRVSIRLNSLSIFGAKLWNCLKPDLRKLRKGPFKNKIHQFLLAVLGNEDDYVDASTLILKITSYH